MEGGRGGSVLPRGGSRGRALSERVKMLPVKLTATL